MLGIFIFLLSSVFFSLILTNIRYVKRLDASERNLKRLEEKRAYNTVDDKLLKEDFGTRMQIFFEEKIDNFLIRKQAPTKTEQLEKMVAKVYRGSKTYKQWEFDRILIATVYFVIGLLAFVLIKELFILPLAIILPCIIYFYFEKSLKSSAEEKDWENFIFFPDMLMSLCMLYKVGAVSTIFQGFKKIEKIYDHPLIDEIKKATKEYDYSKDKYDVLNDLAERVDFKEFTSFVNIVIESEKNNIPIVEPLTEYAYEISAKRKILATNQILKLPEKIDMVMYITSTPICFIYMILPSLKMAIEQLSSNGIL